MEKNWLETPKIRRKTCVSTVCRAVTVQNGWKVVALIPGYLMKTIIKYNLQVCVSSQAIA